MAISRRDFFGQLAVIAAGLVGLRLGERRPSAFRGPGVVEMLDESAWMTVRLNGRPVRLLRSRKVPPDFVIQYDDGCVVASSGLSKREIESRMRLTFASPEIEREFARHVHSSLR